jgi:hypothetical protein
MRLLARLALMHMLAADSANSGGTDMDYSLSTDGIRSRGDLMAERAATARLANHLSSLALRQSERALTGMVALPAAAALGTAAAALFCVAAVERTFEVIETALGEVGRSITSERGEHRTDRNEARA